MIYVIATITTKPGKREEFLAAYRENVAAVRSEPGCLDVETDFGAKCGPDTFVAIGKWQTLERQQAHVASPRPYMLAFWDRTRDFIDRRAVAGGVKRTGFEGASRPATLGSPARAHLVLRVWCTACRHQVDLDPADQAGRYSADLSVPDWAARLKCSQCGSGKVDFVVTPRSTGQ